MFLHELQNYVDIATCIASQGSRYREFQLFKSDGLLTEFGDESPDSLAAEWTARINAWLKQSSNGDKMKNDFKNIKDVHFGTFFFQYPVAAMLLWNVMQEFYELDHIVCGASNTAQETIARWETMEIFEYLKASIVESEWRSSLKDIKRMDGSMQTESWIADIWRVVGSLDEAWEALRRNFGETFEGSKPPKLFLTEIGAAVGRRKSMIDNSLRPDQSAGATGSDMQRVAPNISPHSHELSNLGTTFKPLSRTNSMEAVKEYVVFMTIALKRGEATLGAIFSLFLVLFVLYQVQWCLDANS